MSQIIIATVRPQAETVAVPAAVAQTPPAHRFGQAGLARPRKLIHKTQPARKVAAAPRSIRPAVTRKAAIKKVSQAKKPSTRTAKWWNNLTGEQQKIYLQSHKRTKFKLTKRRGVRKAVDQTINPNAKPQTQAVPPAAKLRSKLSLQEIVRRAEKSLSARDFAWMFSSNKSRYNRIGQEMQEIAAEPKKGEKNYKQKLAAWQAEQAKNNPPQAKVPQNVRNTQARVAKIQRQAAKLPPAKNAKQATQQLFGHLVDQSDNKIIQHVNRRLGAKQKQLLGEAMDYAAKNPQQQNPPRKFAKVLGRVLLFALTTGVGGVLMGPAGVVIALHGIDQFANKTGDSLPQFAWRALQGKALSDKARANEEERATPQLDKHEQPIVAIIEHLKQQLANASSEQQRKPIKNLIELMGDRLDDYNKFAAQDTAPAKRRRG